MRFNLFLPIVFVTIVNCQTNQRWPTSSGGGRFSGIQGPPITNSYTQPGNDIGGSRCDTRSCRCSQDYIPFCGTDGVTYINRCQLSCAQQCNSQLRVKFEGVCAVPYTGVGRQGFDYDQRNVQVTGRPFIVVDRYPDRDVVTRRSTIRTSVPFYPNPTSFPERPVNYPQQRFTTTTTRPFRYDQWGNRVTASTTSRYLRNPQNFESPSSEYNIDWRK